MTIERPLIRRVAVIPMRGGSKGIPGKNLQQVGGKSLAQRTIETCFDAGLEVFVSTDDELIGHESSKFGATVIHRPGELATDASSSESVLEHAIESLNLQHAVIAFVQATSPFISPDHLKKSVEMVETGVADVAFAARESHSFDWTLMERLWEPMGHPKDFRPRRQDLGSKVSETGAFYTFWGKGFLNSGYRFFGIVEPIIVDANFAVDVDAHEDLRWANAIEPLWRQRKISLSGKIKLYKAVKVVFLDFDGVQTDNTVYVDETGRESVAVSRADGLGIRILKESGVEVVVISTEENPVVARRCEKLKVAYVQGVADKGAWIKGYQFEKRIDPEACLYLGNDINDLPARDQVGTFVSVSDAHISAKAASDIVLESAGGKGAIRELADLVLEANRVAAEN